MKKTKTKVRTCNWCYEVYVLGSTKKHSTCRFKKKKFLEARERSINYDKTGGQRDDKTITNIPYKGNLGNGF